MPQPFRFGYQVSMGAEVVVVDAGRRSEAAGFDILLVSDHVGPGRSPLPQLAAVAATTSSLRIGTFVLNSDMRNRCNSHGKQQRSTTYRMVVLNSASALATPHTSTAKPA